MCVLDNLGQYMYFEARRHLSQSISAVPKLKPIIYDSMSSKYLYRNLPSLSFVDIQ